MKRKFLLILSLCVVAVCSALIFTACGHNSGNNNGGGGKDTEQGDGNENSEPYKPTEGLQYTDKGRYYEVHSIGTATDTDIYIPKTYNGKPVTSINESAFSFCGRLTSVTIPDSITSIGTWAFSYCSGLTSITIPDSVTSIGFGAFDYCTGLASAIIGNGITSWGYNVFLECSSLRSVTIKDGLKSIGESTFQNCSSLASISFPDSVTSIGASAFYGCSSLASVTMPNSVTSIGVAAFYGCEISNVYYAGSEQDWSEISIDTYNDALINAPRNYHSDGSEVGDNNEDNKEDNNGDNHTHSYTEKKIAPTCTGNGYILYVCACGDIKGDIIEALGHDYQYHVAQAAGCIVDGWEEYATCSRCDYTTFKSIPALNEHNYVDGYCERCQEAKPTLDTLVFTLKNDNTYEVKAMYKAIQDVNIPSVFNGKLVTSIAESAFNGCTSLTNVTIPNGITSIDSSAFNDCTSLTGITIPDSVTSIGSYAFYGCSSLMSVTIPDRESISDLHPTISC